MFFKRQTSEIDFLLFGLGNPGPRYAGTRHNAGWWVLDNLLQRFGSRRHSNRHRSSMDEVLIQEKRVALIRPTTFMNLSGESVRAWRRDHPEAPWAVVYDDFALDVGKVRVREKGSAGGHNGMKSIISCLDTNEFQRVRVGIGQPLDEEISDYVLSAPLESELEPIRAAVELAARCCIELVQGKVGRAQHLAGGHELPEPKPRTPRPAAAKPKLSISDLVQGRLTPSTESDGAGSKDVSDAGNKNSSMERDS
jgi:PTH1 family peptidyl-tRNA hydrolase